MTTEEAIAILGESLRQNKVMRELPSTFFRSVDIVAGVKNAERRIAALEMAISALRALQPPAKLDRSRWEGCERCNEDWDLDDTELWLYGEQGEIRIVEDEMSCYTGLFWTTEKIKFCPYCGKPLAEEAWAEMEQRIGGNDGKADS